MFIRKFFLMFMLLAACVTPSPVVNRPVKLFSSEVHQIPRDEQIRKSPDGAVASAHPLASLAGASMLKRGGNAVDAALAASFVISVVRPQSTGIGGGGFLLFHDADKAKQKVFDFRERAPGRATVDMFLAKNGDYKDLKFEGIKIPNPAVDGHLSVAVPGLVKGLLEVHERYGKLDRQTVMAPAIDIAEKGFDVYPALARDIRSRESVLKIFPASRKIFLPKGQPLKAWDRLIQKDLAATLKAISRLGSAALYEGEIAQKIIAEIKKGQGILSAADLKAYKMIERIPVSGHYRKSRIVSMPPPSSGGTHIIEMLNMLEPYDLSKMNPRGSEYLHLLSEVMRRAFADRAQEMGDSDFVEVPVARLTSKKHALKLMESFNTEQATDSGLFKKVTSSGESPSTTHISVIDKWGNAVATTQTVNYSFGSCVVADGTGIVLNDEMDDFTTKPGAQNVFGLVTGDKNNIKPWKTPLSSMSPTFVFDESGKPLMVTGSPGGPRIINATLQSIINIVDFKMAPLEAVHATRIHHQWMPDKIYYERDSLDTDVSARLSQMGHKLGKMEAIGDVQAVVVAADGAKIGVSDSRGDGQPAVP